jgi:hypothetical protein
LSLAFCALFSAAILAAAASFSALRLSAASLRAAIRSASSALLSPPAFCFSFIRAFIAAFSWRMVKGEQLGWRIGGLAPERRRTLSLAFTRRERSPQPQSPEGRPAKAGGLLVRWVVAWPALQASGSCLIHFNHAAGAARIFSASSAFLRAFSSLSLCRASFVLLSRPLLSRPFVAAGAGGLRPCASSFAAL